MSHPVLPLSLFVLIVALLGFGSLPLRGELRINEVLAWNQNIEPDNVDFDDYSDWIELFNDGERVSLGEYYLTDDPDEPLKWRFPQGSSIGEGEYLVIRADGYDAGSGETHRREYSPWRNFTTRRHHTNFKLSSSGESVALFRAVDGGETRLIEKQSEWAYFDEGTAVPPEWIMPGFEGEGWKSGLAQFGYGEGDEATTIGYGPDRDDKFITTYFRRVFTVTDPEALEQPLALQALVDDGAIVYLNGVEVLRVRMPEESVSPGTPATASAEEQVFENWNLPAGALTEGFNVMAVEIHQEAADSSDVSFDLELSVYVPPTSVVEVDRLSFGQQAVDVSLGRDPANPEEWVRFGEPTPGLANTGTPVTRLEEGPAVIPSRKGGFFSGGLTLLLGADEAPVHYTLDGGIPTADSIPYEGPIEIEATTVVRARSFPSGKLPGPILTSNYFVDSPAHELPVVSFVGDPDNLFDSEIGVYRNVHKGRETPINLAFYEDLQLRFQTNGGMRIGGENIWRFAQKPLTVYFRGKYGSDILNYPVFEDRPIGEFGRISFRNGGDNWPNAMLRDAMTPFILAGRMENDVQAYRPVVLYLNGEYWGIHNLREKFDRQYFAATHRVDPANIDHLEYGNVPEGGVSLIVNLGDDLHYRGLQDFFRNNPLSEDAHFDYVASQVDMDSLIDWICIEDFVSNSSWRHNREFWRERKAGAKWKFIVPDLDRGFQSNRVRTSYVDNFLNEYPLVSAVLENEGFRNRFLQRYATHLSTTFHADRLTGIVNRLDADVRSELARHSARWRRDGSFSVQSRSRELDEIRDFAEARPQEVRDDLRTVLNMTNSDLTLTVLVDPPGAGEVRIEGVSLMPEFTNEVTLFHSLPLEVEARAAPGFRFAGFSFPDQPGQDEVADSRFQFSLLEDRTLSVRFEASNERFIGPEVEGDLRLTAGTPWTSDGDVRVPRGSSLTLEAGVEWLLPPGASIYVEGALQVEGTLDQPVRILPRFADQPWGGLCFVNPDRPSRLSHLTIRGATQGNDPINLKAAISGLNADLTMEYLDLDEVNFPIFIQGGRTVLSHSRIHTEVTCDYINIKRGAGRVAFCEFPGNLAPDTDAIDFDGVVNGEIEGNRIYRFEGPNSDGIDVGEACQNLLILGNRIYGNSDKGVSVGQASSCDLRRNVIVDCSQGVAVKDFESVAWLDGNTLVGNAVALASFEKNLGAGGGTIEAKNCILSRSKDHPLLVDSLSALSITYSLSDTLPLPGEGNLHDNPGFIDPAVYDFGLSLGSVAIDSGDPAVPFDEDGTRVDMGADYHYQETDYPFRIPNQIVINEILAHSEDGKPDWVELKNTSVETVDVGGWFLSDNAGDLRRYRIAEGTVIPGGGFLVLYEDLHFGEASTDPGKAIPFALSENGESVHLFAEGDSRYSTFVETEDYGPSRAGVTAGR
ncbi:MAG: CotH kinase family protein, partial [Verrucomicrobiota bacterium]